MADCDDPFACAVREVTRRCGPMIWRDPGRLRSRLQYEIGPVSDRQSAVLDCLVIAAMQGIPGALIAHDDLQPWMLALSDAVGPLLAAEALSVWMRALAVPESPCGGKLEPASFVVESAPGVIVIDVESVEVERAPLADDMEPVDERVLTLLDKLRPPPPVPVSA